MSLPEPDKPRESCQPAAVPPLPNDSVDLSEGHQDHFGRRLRERLFGKARDLRDRSIFHKLSLVPLLAWVGLGADGLSSSSYGPEEAYLALGEHTWLALALAIAVTSTVFIIASAYEKIIEHFPHGGGGYVVASKLLGPRAGVLSGCALLVDYMLTITVSIAASGDAIFSLLPPSAHGWKVPFEVILILGLTTLNIRGVKESILVLLPIFLVFLLTHVTLILGVLVKHWHNLFMVEQSVAAQAHSDLTTVGLWGMVLLFFRAYSRGAGTYTGLEAVSNGLPIMREPRVQTAQRTMRYMAWSLSFVASGLLVGYLLVNVQRVQGQTLNASLITTFVGNHPLGPAFRLVAMASAGALLVVAAQAGFIDGPRVLANMSLDYWVPRQFAALSERLTTHKGIVLMGAASMIALLFTHGNTTLLVVMYSINVFVTFSLSMFAMLLFYWKGGATQPQRKRRLIQFGLSFLMCATILVIIVIEKFPEGGWVTIVATGICVGLCFLINRHYRSVGRAIRTFDSLTEAPPPPMTDEPSTPEPNEPTAVFLVSGFNGSGMHLLLSVIRDFPNHFKNIVFISVGVVDAGRFKGEHEIEQLAESVEKNLTRYADYAQRLGFATETFHGVGSDLVDEVEKLSIQVMKKYPRAKFFAGHLIFMPERWYQRFLHNEAAYAIQMRLQRRGTTIFIYPLRVKLA